MLEHMLNTFCSLPLPVEELKVGLRTFLAEQLRWCEDSAFSARFPFTETGLPQHFFQQKIIHVEGAAYLTGPRYFDGDISRPFIELLANSAPVTATVAREIFRVWLPLGASSIRILRHAGQSNRGTVDQLIYARQIPVCTDISLTPIDTPALVCAATSDLDWCMAAIHSSYQETYNRLPQLRDRLKPAAEEDVRNAIISGNVYIIHHTQRASGLIISEYGQRAFLSGHWITEEIILPEYWGEHIAAAAQCELLRSLAKKTVNSTLLGTIIRDNTPSIRAAERANRGLILEYAFLQQVDFND